MAGFIRVIAVTSAEFNFNETYGLFRVSMLITSEYAVVINDLVEVYGPVRKNVKLKFANDPNSVIKEYYWVGEKTIICITDEGDKNICLVYSSRIVAEEMLRNQGLTINQVYP